MAKKKKGSKNIIVVVAVLAIVVVLGVVFVPRLVHTCDSCEKTFVGTGYQPNILADALEFVGAEHEEIICEACAESEHALSILAGKTVDDFKLPLFGEKEEA
ncbi:MAG: hypothetical protein J6Q94_10045 [Clostridia bacterium]|nr:hypothetical protein [Clostridia bacterium]